MENGGNGNGGKLLKGMAGGSESDPGTQGSNGVDRNVTPEMIVSASEAFVGGVGGQGYDVPSSETGRK